MRRIQPPIAASVVRMFFRYSRRRPQPDLIDDLVQQVFTKLCAGNCAVLRRLDGQDEAAFLAYLRTTAGNIAIDYLRTRNQAFEPLDPALPDDGVEFARLVELREEIEKHLEVCSGKDARRDRVIFWLYYRNGLSAKDIAAIPRFGLNPKGVESLIFRIGRCIRAAVAKGIPRPEAFHKKGGRIGTVI